MPRETPRICLPLHERISFGRDSPDSSGKPEESDERSKEDECEFLHHIYVSNVSGCMGGKRKSRGGKDREVRAPAVLFISFEAGIYLCLT
jgi:hypothetical protein